MLAGDFLLWTLNESCLVGLHATRQQTEQHSVTGGSQQMQLHKGTDPGIYKLCYKPSVGIWTHVTYQNLTVVARPVYLPVMGMSGTVTVITFMGSMHTPLGPDYSLHTATDGDFVVMTAHGTSCDDAHTITAGTAALPRTNVSDLQVSTTMSMTATTQLHLCYALQLSGGDSADDYATLDHAFSQLDFDPKRIISGAPQLITVDGGGGIEAGNQILWALGGCPTVATINGTGLQTDVFTLTSSFQTVQMHPNLDAGEWILCHSSPSSSDYNIDHGYITGTNGGYSTGWTAVPDSNLTVMEKPLYDPIFGFAGVPTELQLDENAQDGDLIVMQYGGCHEAHLAVTDGTHLGRTVLVNRSVSTLDVMDVPLVYTLCYATIESNGDQSEDFSPLEVTYTAFGFEPTRTVYSAAQVFSLQVDQRAACCVYVSSALCVCEQCAACM